MFIIAQGVQKCLSMNRVAQIYNEIRVIGFKNLGFLFFVAENGDEEYLSGSVVSLRTITKERNPPQKSGAL